MKRYREALLGMFDDTIHNIGILLLLNLGTTVLVLPVLVVLDLGLGGGLLGGYPLVAGTVVAILTCPLTAPLQTAANRLARGYSLWVMQESREVLRKHGFLLLRLWIIDLIVTALMLANLTFYTSSDSPILVVMRFVWVYFLLAWLAMHMYLYPLVIEDRVDGALETYRMALQITMLFPGFTLVIGVLWLLLVGLLSLTGILAVLGLALTATLQHHALAALLELDPLQS